MVRLFSHYVPSSTLYRLSLDVFLLFASILRAFLFQYRGAVPEMEVVAPSALTFALAMMVHHAKQACAVLAVEGIEVELIDPRTLAPLDTATVLASVRKTGRLLLVDEDFAPYSGASEIAAAAVAEGFDDLDAPVKRLHGAFAPVPYSPPLEKQLVPDAEAIAHAVRELMEE